MAKIVNVICARTTCARITRSACKIIIRARAHTLSVGRSVVSQEIVSQFSSVQSKHNLILVLVFHCTWLLLVQR